MIGSLKPQWYSFQQTRHRKVGFTLVEVAGSLLGVLLVAGVLVALLLPVSRGREPSRRSQCRNNLKQIGLALHNYLDTYGAFPPAHTVDAQGKPLHSWRTLILPFIDQHQLYQQIDLSKPWDDPANAVAFNTRIAVFECPGATGPERFTQYLASSGAPAFLHPTKPRPKSEIGDGLSNTLMVLEVDADHAVHWMSPVDADAKMILGFDAKSKFFHSGGHHAVLGDGSVRFLDANMKTETLKALISIDGQEVVEEY